MKATDDAGRAGRRLRPLLDNRRYVESIVAGIKIKAHPNFRLVTTMNDDASTFELPEYIHSRLQPQIYIDFPERDEEMQILRENLPFAEDRILEYVTEFLQHAHAADERYSVRDGINVGRYAIKLKSLATKKSHETGALETAVIEVLVRKRCAMRGETTEPHLDFGSLVRGRFTYFPVVPGKLEFALAVRQAILTERPGVVALELPACLRDAYLRAIERLPQMTVIFYPEGEEDEAVYIPVEPCDPFTEAIRSGTAVGAEIVFTDPDMGDRPHLPDSYPDTYALQSISVEQYVESYRVYPQERSDVRMSTTRTASRGSCRALVTLHGQGTGGALVESAGSGSGCDGASAGAVDAGGYELLNPS